MKIKRILLTGDDGYNSIGTRLLIRHLKDKYQLQIAATQTQQSGVGGKLSVTRGGTWGQTMVDGVPTLWVSGTPGDAVECAYSLFKKPFDLVISGINLGANVAGAIASGTLNAARRAVKLPLAPQAIAISWDTPSEFWFKNHSGKEDISEYLKHPGKTSFKTIEYILKNSLWGCALINVNIPKKKTNKAIFTKFLFRLNEFYDYPINIDKTTHRYSYPNQHLPATYKHRLHNDAFALNAGYISITPCHPDTLHLTAFKKLKGKTPKL
jgi:5'-nucleotidase